MFGGRPCASVLSVEAPVCVWRGGSRSEDVSVARLRICIVCTGDVRMGEDQSSIVRGCECVSV